MRQRPPDVFAGTPYSNDWAAVLSTERDCARWVKLDPGRTPREHLDVDIREEVREYRREARTLARINLGVSVVAVLAAIAAAAAAFIK